MRILCINTAFANSDVAIKCDEITDTIALPSSAKQSENILCAVDELLTKNNLNIQQFDAMSCVVGPGSFTGVRIGVGLVKGMKLAKPQTKLISICSLDLMAHIWLKNNPQNDYWCVLNALSGNIFACKYDKQGNRLITPKMMFGDELLQIKGQVVGTQEECIELATDKITLDATSLLDYSVCKYNNGEFCEENEFLPIYLRKSQAECQLEQKNGN